MSTVLGSSGSATHLTLASENQCRLGRQRTRPLLTAGAALFAYSPRKLPARIPLLAHPLLVVKVAHEPAIKELLSIGPATAELLGAAGISTVQQFQEMGSVETFRTLRRLDPTLGFQVLWRLESALTNRLVGAITAERRAEMLQMIGGRPRPPLRRPLQTPAAAGRWSERLDRN